MPAPSTIVRIGVDYDGEYELLLITSWMAEWSGAPPLPPREAGGAGDRFPLPPEWFLRFLAILWSNVLIYFFEGADLHSVKT